MARIIYVISSLSLRSCNPSDIKNALDDYKVNGTCVFCTYEKGIVKLIYFCVCVFN